VVALLSSGCIKAGLNRSCGLAARYGGEEFAVLLPMTDLKGALYIAEAILARAAARRIPHMTSLFGIVTVSAGAAGVYPQHM